MGEKFGKKAETIQHKGVEIIVTDYSGLKGQELLEAMKENAKIIVPKVTGRHDCLMVNLFIDCQLTDHSLKYIAKIQRAMDGTFVASALVGMSAIQRAGIEITGSISKSGFQTRFFDTPEEAMDWAAEEYKKINRPPRQERH
jgi:hypothetical protein